jgi:Tfp pilus assembly protein PilF
MTALSSESVAALSEAERELTAGSLQRAAEGLERAARRAPDAPLLCALGALQLLLGQDASAQQSLRRSLCSDPLNGLSRHLYGLVLWKAGRLREAAGQLRICHLRAPLDPDVLMALSLVSREIGDVDEACRTQERALQVDSRDAQIWAAAGALATSLGQNESASMAYRTALALARA